MGDIIIELQGNESNLDIDLQDTGETVSAMDIFNTEGTQLPNRTKLQFLNLNTYDNVDRTMVELSTLTNTELEEMLR